MKTVTQHIIQHKKFLPENVIYGFLGKHPKINIHRYRGHEDAAKNREIILRLIDNRDSRLSLVKQLHGINCNTLSVFEDVNYDFEADIQITKNKDIILATHTADCVPVLFVDQIAGVVSTVHAGWKGALAGIIDVALDKMKKADADIFNIAAIIGPCIKQDSYEVSQDFINQFLLEDINNSKFFVVNKNSKDKYFFDLLGYVRTAIERNKIRKIYDVEINTLTHPNFFSYREACLAGKKLDGHNLSFIGLKI